ncbi:diguanylate cyclase [Vibrio sp. JPW-9-11-11]|uniref:GGDEF domain-containing protein n=1 Tax=Vibrio sp. JPW-9-11-11 TaxID=1416532 RepID=UPI001592D080|nr:diguanylate cyclase [Vibrio sp. JPW-9-11-11]NVD07122.1 diguanylate cyclase [Vibrio sp. JPW-9-11-11]
MYKQKRLEFELYSNASGTLYSHSLFGLIAVILLWPYQDAWLLVIWLGCLWGNIAVRGLFVWRWLRATKAERNPPRMALMAKLTSLVNGIIWPVSLLFLDLHLYPIESMVVVIAILGLAAGSAFYASFMLSAFYISTTAYLLSLGVFFAAQNEMYGYLTALGLVTIWLMLHSQAKHSHSVYQKYLSNDERNQELMARLEKLSLTDQVTQLSNRHFYAQVAEKIWLQHARHNQALSFLMVDLDNFKHVNDAYGHRVGDDLLNQVGQILKSHTRRTDYLFRWGGDEFLVILPCTSADESLKVAEKVKHALEQHCHSVHNRQVSVTASLGTYSCFPQLGNSIAGAIDLADLALLRAKKSGRNTVSSYTQVEHASLG